MPERDMLSLGVMGLGGWTWPEILPPSSPSPPPSGGRGRGEAGGIRNTSYTGAILCPTGRAMEGMGRAMERMGRAMERTGRVCYDYKSTLGL